MTFQLCIRQNVSLDIKRMRMANMKTPLAILDSLKEDLLEGNE